MSGEIPIVGQVRKIQLSAEVPVRTPDGQEVLAVIPVVRLDSDDPVLQGIAQAFNAAVRHIEFLCRVQEQAAPEICARVREEMDGEVADA